MILTQIDTQSRPTDLTTSVSQIYWGPSALGASPSVATGALPVRRSKVPSTFLSQHSIESAMRKTERHARQSAHLHVSHLVDDVLGGVLDGVTGLGHLGAELLWTPHPSELRAREHRGGDTRQTRRTGQAHSRTNSAWSIVCYMLANVSGGLNIAAPSQGEGGKCSRWGRPARDRHEGTSLRQDLHVG